MPGAEQRYLAELASRVLEVLGVELVGVYVGGSWALGDYEPGRSDLDVSAVARARTSRALAEQLGEALNHSAFPCPARGLEFVLYPQESARSPSVEPGFDLNLNTGSGMQERMDFGPVAGEGHWFAIDRSILAQHGVALYGPEAAGLFAPIPRDRLLPVLAESLRWMLEAPRVSTNAVLSACRSLRFAADGAWLSKRAAGEWMVARGDEPELIGAALRARVGEPASLDERDAADFVQRALVEIAAA
jgi:hypothetical protein